MSAAEEETLHVKIHPSYSCAMNKHLYRASELHLLKLAYT